MNYRLTPPQGDSVAVPQLVFARLSAEEANVRVALYVLATGVTDADTIARDLCLRGRQSAERALAYWAGAGLLEAAPDEQQPPPAPEKPPMSWAEIERASRTDPMVAAIVQCAQTSFGRSLGRKEMEGLVALYIQDGYHPEVILLCLTTLAGQGKTTLAALRHELKAWQAEGVTTGEEADAYLQTLYLRAKREAFVCEKLEQQPQSLTQGARQAIARWYEQYGFDDAMITEAAIQAGPHRDLWYWNRILNGWHAKGLRTVHEVRGGGAVSAPVGRNVRVDRQTYSSETERAVQAVMERPRRLKRKD